MRQTLSRPDAVSKLEAFGFYALLGLIVASVWYYPYLTSTDGPDHAANAALIVDLLTGRCPRAAQFFVFNSPFIPNWTGHAIMAFASFLGANLLQVEKILFSLCVILPAVGLRRLTALSQKNDFRSWIGPAIGLNQLIVFNGLYNFTLGLGVFLLATAYYFKRGDKPTKRFCLIFTLLLILAWYSHLLAFLFIGTVVFVHEIFFVRPKQNFTHWIKARWMLGSTFIPALILTAFYFLQPTQTYDLTSDGTTLGNKLSALLFMKDFYQVKADDPNLMIVYGAIGIPILCFVLKKLIQKTKDPVFLSLVTATVIFWFVSFILPPSVLGGWMLKPRFNMAGWYLLLAAAMRFTWNKSALQIFVIATVVMTIGNIQAFAVKRYNMEMYADKTVAALPVLKPNSTFYNLPLKKLVLPNDQKPLFAPDAGVAFLPVANIMADRSRCIINLNNYEAQHDYFPLRFKSSEYPGPVWGNLVYDDADKKYYNNLLDIRAFDPIGYHKKSGLKVDYILIEGNLKKLIQDEDPKYALQKDYYRKNASLFDKKLRNLTPTYNEIYRQDDTLRLYQRR